MNAPCCWVGGNASCKIPNVSKSIAGDGMLLQVLWVGVDQSAGGEKLMNLQSLVQEAMQGAGVLHAEDTSFIPHVTVCKTSR